MHTHNQPDLLHGPLSKNLLRFTLPIALSSMLQQLFNAADTSIVGFFDHADALAAVGTNGELVALIVSLSSGLSLGANILMAHQLGKQQTERIGEILRTAMTLAGILGFLGLLLGELLASPLLSMIRTPSSIMPSAERYLRIYLLGCPFLLFYDFGAALLRARGNSRYPFLALTASGIVNVILNLFFVMVLKLGVAGVSAATVLSTALSAFLVFLRLRTDYNEWLPSFRCASISRADLGRILKIGIPAAIQGAVFCFANMFVQASVNEFGSIAIAGSTIAMNMEYFTYYVITAFGQTASTFVSQNYAAGQLRRCRNILRLCLVYSILFSTFLIEPLVFFRRFCAGLFSTEAPVIQAAGLRMLCILLFEPVCCLYEIPSGALRGTGRSLLPALMTVLGTCAFRIAWIYTVFSWHHTLPVLFAAFPLSWGLTILLILGSYLAVRPFRE